MLIVIPNKTRTELTVQDIASEYATDTDKEIKEVLIAYFAMLQFSMETNMKPPLLENAVSNTISKAMEIFGNKCETNEIHAYVDDIESYHQEEVDKMSKALSYV